MNGEIKQLIELQINARIIENRSNYALFNEGMKKGAEIAQSIILSKWQEANRWRKVSEELPEHSGNPFLVRGHFKINDKVSMVSRYFVAFQDMDFYKEFGKVIFDAPVHFVVTEWKPIK